MNYDVPDVLPTDDRIDVVWPVLSFVELESCCALQEACYFPYDANQDHNAFIEKDCWQALCELAAKEKPSFFTLSEKSQQTMINLVEACPDVTFLAQIPSRQGKYMVNLYLFQK
jgi:hypothetical protein